MTTGAEEAARQGRLRFVAVLGGAIASGMKLEAWFALLDDELQALGPRRDAFERACAEAWFAAKAHVKPRLPRGTLQRADLGDPAALTLIAEREARWAAEGRDAHGRKKRPRELETA